jgi:hypothetical protein
MQKKNPNRQIHKSNFIEYNKKVKEGSIKKEFTNQFTKAKKEGRVVIVSSETREKISKELKGRIWSSEQKRKHSERMKKVVKDNPLSYSAKNISGRVKNLVYKDKIVKGSWELLVAKKLDSENIKWDNEIDGIEYFWNGSKHLYFPDFYLEEFDIYLEVKGYQRDRDLAKWKVLNNLIVLKLFEISLIKENKLELKSLIACSLVGEST